MFSLVGIRFESKGNGVWSLFFLFFNLSIHAMVRGETCFRILRFKMKQADAQKIKVMDSDSARMFIKQNHTRVKIVSGFYMYIGIAYKLIYIYIRIDINIDPEIFQRHRNEINKYYQGTKTAHCRLIAQLLSHRRFVSVTFFFTWCPFMLSTAWLS